jgi:hypothetical protein
VTSPSAPVTTSFPGSREEPSTFVSVERALSSSSTLNLLVGIGMALRVWAYGAGVSLWLDELLVSRNILGLPLRDLLTKPLQLDQVAPRGFLLVEKLSVLTFGQNEYALRLFPFLCALASVWLFRRLAERALDGLAVPFAVALFAIGVPVIQYGVEVKQYIVDATVAILLLLVALGLRDPDASTRRLVFAGLFGWVVIWFSQASVVMMGGIGVALAVQWLMTRDRPTARVLFVTMPIWAAASIVAILAGLRSMSPSTREFMDDFWRGGFLPLPVTLGTALRWIWNQSLSFFTDLTLLRYRWPVLFLGIAVLGLIGLWRRRRDVALLLLGPLVVALVAAVAHEYPFRGRLMFYLVPGLLLAVAAGAELVRRGVNRVHPSLGLATMVGLLVSPVMTLAQDPPPYEIENNRTVYAYLQRKRQPGDVVHIFPLSRVGALFYGPRYGLQPGDWTTARCDRNNTRTYVRDVDRYRGQARVWVLAAGNPAYRTARAAVRGYLSTIGIRRDSLVLRSLTYGSIALELYDLSDSTRLGAADAESFPVEPMPTNPRPGCRPWIRPSALDSLR